MGLDVSAGRLRRAAQWILALALVTTLVLGSTPGFSPATDIRAEASAAADTSRLGSSGDGRLLELRPRLGGGNASVARQIGSTWTVRFTGDHLMGVACPNTTVCAAVGTEAVLLTSASGGNAWDVHTS